MTPVARATGTALIALLSPLAAAGQEAPTAADALLDQGRVALESGELETAETLFGAALEIEPELAAAWLGASVVAERRGDLVGALERAQQAARTAPEAASTHLAVGRLLTALGRTGAALAALAKARRLAPREPLAYQLAALLLRDSGRDEEATALLQTGLEKIPSAPVAMSAELAGLHLAADEAGKALEVIDRALERFPDRGELHLARGLALAAGASGADAEAPAALEAAASAFAEALRHGVDRPARARLALAGTLAALGRDDEVLEHLEAAARLEPDSPEVHYRLGSARQRAGDPEGARVALERFRQLSQAADRADHDLKKRGAEFNEAQELVAAGRLKEALERLDALLAEEPGWVRALVLKAKVLFSLERKQEAVEAVRAARARGPGSVEPHVLAGMFLMDLGRAAEAEAALLQAVALAPDLGDAHALLGAVAADTARPEEAVERFARALELGAEGVALRLRYAEVLHTLGRIEESKAQLEVYRALLETGADSAEAPPEPGG